VSLLVAEEFLRGPAPRGYGLGLHAFGKVNLGLRVGRRRPDGFHEIRTVLQTIDLADTLYARPASRLRLSVRVVEPARGRGLALGPPARNLVLRAARLLRAERKVLAGADLLLIKRIPPGSGLGGGSSDAVAALRLLGRMWGIPLPLAEIERLALRLGSDCPFFARGGRARARGRGEILRFLPVPRQRLVVVLPRRGVATREAYRLFAVAKRLTGGGPARRLLAPLSPRQHLDRARSGMPNLLEQVVCRRYPEVARARELLALPGVSAVQMSGSGSAVFGILSPGVRPNRLVPLQLEGSSAAVACRFTRTGARWCT
jgi:4-diphosphocytidyl-2-C-methyl-D-erythritol kinase